MLRIDRGPSLATGAVLAILAAIVPAFGQQKGDPSAFLAERLQAIRGQPLNLDTLVKQNWLQIPAAELARRGIATRDYAEGFANPAAILLEGQSAKLEESLKLRFDTLKLDALKAQRDRGEPITYCGWIPAARPDGLIPGTTDFLMRFRRTCRGFAIETTRRLGLELARTIDPSLGGIRQLTDSFPRWLVGDLMMASAEGPNPDLIAFDQAYRESALASLQKALPAMQSSVAGYFRTLGAPGMPLPQPATLCRETLGAAYSLTGFGREASEALRATCRSEGRNWATRHLATIETRLVEAILRRGEARPIRSAEHLCAEASGEILGEAALLEDARRQTLSLRCQEEARGTESRMITRSVAGLLEPLRPGVRTIQDLAAASWLVFDGKRIASLLDAREATNTGLVQKVIERANTDAAPIRDSLIKQTRDAIVKVHSEARKSLVGLQTAQELCAQILRYGKIVPAPAGTGVAGLQGQCQSEQAAFYQERIEQALARSGIASLSGKVLVVERGVYNPKALVAYAALSGRQLTFSRSWWGGDIRFSVTSAYGGPASLGGKLKADETTTRLILSDIDPLPGYSADPIAAASCLFSSPDDDARKAAEVLGEMRTLFEGLFLAWRSQMNQELCNKALRAVFAS